MTTAFSGGNASARARTRCHKFHFQSRRCRDKLTCLLPPSWSALTPSSNKSQSLEDMCHRTHVMSRNMRSLLRACVLFLNLRKEKGTATETDLGARSLFRHLLKGAGGGGGLCRSLAGSVGGFSVGGSNNGRCKETLIVARRMGWEASCLA